MEKSNLFDLIFYPKKTFRLFGGFGGWSLEKKKKKKKKKKKNEKKLS